jgi:hypothetical protein
MASHVEVQHVAATGSAHFKGLETCGSVWVCPVCAAKITERRRKQLQRIVNKHIELGGSVYMTTYTISHHKYDDLEDLLRRFQNARRRSKQGRVAVDLREEFQVFGTVSVLEVTWSPDNGWHPHCHELVFCMLPKLDEDGFERTMRASWERAAAHEGLSMNRHGFELQRTFGAVADYIAKFGREPAKGDNAWGIESEMTKGHLKKGRTDQHYTPFALLQAIADGRDDLKPVFAEYARCFKGRKQMTSSPGLFRFYDEMEKSDEELVAEQEEEATTLVLLDGKQWAAVVGNDIRAELLEVARSGSVDLVVTFLAGFGIDCSLPPEEIGGGDE